MSIIYSPTGRAQEYSPKAINIYLECSHGCKYCYAPTTLHKTKDDFFKKATPRKDIVSKLKRQLETETITEQVLLSFASDPFGPSMDENATTWEILKLLGEYNVPTAVLTKNPGAIAKNLEIVQRFGSSFAIGTTLTFRDEMKSKIWEPNAPTSFERLVILQTLKHIGGFTTFASFEPVIEPNESLELLKLAIGVGIDSFKLGKLSGMPEIEKTIDWSDYLSQAVRLLRCYERSFYVKDDLADAAKDVELTAEERDPRRNDVHCIQGVPI